LVISEILNSNFTILPSNLSLSYFRLGAQSPPLELNGTHIDRTANKTPSIERAEGLAVTIQIVEILRFRLLLRQVHYSRREAHPVLPPATAQLDNRAGLSVSPTF